MKRKVVISVLLVSILATLANTQTARGWLVRWSGVAVARDCRVHGFTSSWGTSGPRLYPSGVDVSRLVWCWSWWWPHTIAYARAGVPRWSFRPYVYTFTWVWWPGRWARAWGWVIDPGEIANNTFSLEEGITLTQNGSAQARYEITMTDMNTTTDYTYWAQLENGTFTASANWIVNWTEPATGVRKFPPMNITIEAMPADHFGNCSHQAKVTSYTEHSLAIANSTEKPEEPAVGGVWVPVDKLALLTPYIALASTIVVATAATAIYVKHAKRRKKKQ